MTPPQYLQCIHEEARADQLLSLQRGVAPTTHDLLQLAIDMANARGVEIVQTTGRYQTVEPMEGATRPLKFDRSVTVEVSACARIQYQLCGRIQALVDYYNGSRASGAKLVLTKKAIN